MFEAVAQAVREVVCRVDPPLVAGAVVRFLDDAVGGEIPHLRVAVVDVLFHAEEGFAGFVFAVAHGSEFGE